MQHRGGYQGDHGAFTGAAGNGTHFVSLYDMLETIRQTGVDIQVKYKRLCCLGCPSMW